MEYVRHIDTADSNSIWEPIDKFLSYYKLWDKDQISLASTDGMNDWQCSIGKKANLQFSERMYSQVLNFFKDSELEKFINKHNKFYRWRLMKIDPRKTYTLHKDSDTDKLLNIRLHLPLKTNKQSYLTFFEDNECNGAKFYNLKIDNVYELNTSGYHSAINFGLEPRWHLVGVKYENSNYWS